MHILPPHALVNPVQIGPALHQHAHHVQVIALGGHVQRSLIFIIRHVRTHSLLEQDAGHLHLTGTCGRVQERVAVIVLDVRVCPLTNQGPDHRLIPPPDSDSKNGVAGIITGVGIRAVFQEEMDELGSIMAHGHMEGRLFIVVAGLDLGTPPEQQAGNLQLVEVHGKVKRAIIIVALDIG